MGISDGSNKSFATQILNSQAHVTNHSLSFVGPMTLKCAVELCIPDHIHSYGHAMPLHELARAIGIPPSKDEMLSRLMRLLVQQGIFEESERETYRLTALSQILVNGDGPNLGGWVRMIDEMYIKPWLSLSGWFTVENTKTPFEMTHGKKPWEMISEMPKKNKMFNEAMARRSLQMVKGAVQQYPELFHEAKTLVDVGGGNGITVSVIVEAFPGLKCMVFDLPHVVATMPESKVFDKLAGSMFDMVPPADVVLLKNVLHDWSDEECVRILRKCKEAIPAKGGKVVIMDLVVGSESEVPKAAETTLFFDLIMMVSHGGKERDENEWKKLFDEAGYSHYKLHPTFSVTSIIELFP